jgi:hypothetical protein
LLKQIYVAADLDQFQEALLQMFRSPQIKLIVQAIHGETPGVYGRDYLVEQETGALFVRILPPNVRDLNDDQLGNLLALGMRYTPAGFVLIGRPDFTEAAYVKARQFATTYAKQVLLYPAYEICERYVQAIEGNAVFRL